MTRPLTLLTLLFNVAKSSSLSFCCNALLQAGLENSIITSNISTYQTELATYFSSAAALPPSCFFQPKSTIEVSQAIKALVAANETQPCQFAVRSGGHNSVVGASGIVDGVTFDLSLLSEIVYHPENSTVTVGPGAVWEDVYKTLDPLGVMVVGGRATTVGVGGLLLGGGNSFYAARFGLACDNVLRYGIVLGNGSIIIADSEQHKDLFRALKGGSNNFGIVTHFSLNAFPNGDQGIIWGGVVTYPIETADAQLQAVVDFTNNIEKEPYGSVILITHLDMGVSSTPVFLTTIDYTKPGSDRAEAASAFHDFFAIPGNLSDTTGKRNLTSLVGEFDLPNGDRVDFSTLTFKNDFRVMRKAHEVFLQAVEELKAEATGDWGIETLYQPIPTLFAKLGEEQGENVLGLDRFHENLILYQPYLYWQGEEQDELFREMARWIIGEIDAYAKSIDADCDWIYLNYADGWQRPLEGYGRKNVEKIRRAARKYDPEGVFQTMVPGGFKISDVDERVSEKGGGHWKGKNGHF